MLVRRLVGLLGICLAPCSAYTAVGRFGHSAVLVNDRFLSPSSTRNRNNTNNCTQHRRLPQYIFLRWRLFHYSIAKHASLDIRHGGLADQYPISLNGPTVASIIGPAECAGRPGCIRAHSVCWRTGRNQHDSCRRVNASNREASIRRPDNSVQLQLPIRNVEHCQLAQQ